MKPYFLVVYNLIRFRAKRLLGNPGFRTATIQMLSANTRIVLGKGANVHLGERTVSDGRTVIIAGNGAELTIGSRVYFNEEAMISCKKQIYIGDGCQFGPNVKIFDNDHKFDANRGVLAEHATTAVHIGNHCWLGANVVVLRGTHIGEHCVIGAGCVVKGNIPDGSLVTMGRELNIRPIEDRTS